MNVESTPAQIWRTSSRVVFVLTLLVLSFCNVPGQSMTRMEYVVGYPFYEGSQFAHGWPLTYLVRADFPGHGRGRSVDAESDVGPCFQLWSDVELFRPWLLVANSCIVLLISCASGYVFDRWRRKRKSILQLHLRDTLAATLALSLLAAWCVHVRQRHAMEEKLRRSEGLAFRSYQVGGITWLRLSLGEKYFRYLDRPYSVAVIDHDGWRQLGKLPTLRHVEAEFPGDTEEVAHLAELPRLEALTLIDTYGSEMASVNATLPSLPRLRGLFLSQPDHRYRGIDQLTSLQSVRVTEDCIDRQVLREISALTNLRELALNGLTTSDDLSFLPSLHKLTALNLYHSVIDVEALKSVGGCSKLKDLSLNMCRVEEEGLCHLSSLTNLEKLNLEHANLAQIRGDCLESVRRALPNCEIIRPKEAPWLGPAAQ